MEKMLVDIAKMRVSQYAKNITKKFNEKLSDKDYQIIVFAHYFNFIFSIPTLIKSLERTNFNSNTFKYDPVSFNIDVASKDDLGKIMEIDTFYPIEFDTDLEFFPVNYLISLIDDFLKEYNLGSCEEVRDDNNRNRKYRFNIDDIYVEDLINAYNCETNKLLIWYKEIIQEHVQDSCFSLKREKK